ncbi:MAG: phosphatase PAP2 family protein, partial [Acidimicrobiales bacterium]
ESVLVNGLIKSVFRRVRPVSAKPHPLPLRVPRTSSFPSGHASAAFAAAALLRDDPLWPAIYALATVVATSRVHVRMHHASDVIAGAVVGAALGELSRHLLPLEPRRPAITADNSSSLRHR